MSWLARSLANSLRIDDHHHHGDDDGTDTDESPSPSHRRREITPGNAAEVRDTDDGDLRGVKEDLSEFRESVTRQLWGVANFLAPPPPPPPPPTTTTTTRAATSAIKDDRRFRSQLNRPESISGYDEFDDDDDNDQSPSRYGRDHSGRNYRNLHKRDDVSMNCELRTVNEEEDYDEEGEEEEEEEDEDSGGDDWIGDVAGLTDEVLTFAGNIAHHPETWLDFPVEDDEDFDDFPMSESQKRHTQAVEHLTPRLAALRIELCPAHMSIGFFWNVYFVLLHSRLNKQDTELLSTPEVVEARAKWMQELQKRAKKDSERYHGGQYGSADFDEDFTPRSLQNDHSETHSSWTFASEPATSSTADSDTEKQVVSTEMHSTEKSINDEKSFSDTNYKYNFATAVSKRPAFQFDDDDDDDDDWPEDDCLGQNGKVISFGIDEDISFSDLEDDDCCIPVISKPDFEV